MDNNRDKTFFTNAYLMTTSVIQAAAFGALVFAIDNLQKASILAQNWPYLTLSFITIVVLSYGYIMGAHELRWPLDGFDILIPFLLGLFQSVASLSLPWGPVCFFQIYLLFAVTGFLALANSWVKTFLFAKDIYQERFVMRISALVALIAMCALCIIPLWIHRVTKSTISFNWFAIFLCVVYALLFIGWCCKDWKKKSPQHALSADRKKHAR